MADISTELSTIKSAVYGKDMRTAIHNGIKKVNEGTIGTDKIENAAVTGNKLATGAVSTNKLYTGAVTTEKIADGAVTEDKLSEELTEVLNDKVTVLARYGIATADGPDLNDLITEQGVYSISTAMSDSVAEERHFPLNDPGILLVFKTRTAGSPYWTQIYVSASGYGIFGRYYNVNSGFKDWEQLATKTMVDSAVAGAVYSEDSTTTTKAVGGLSKGYSLEGKTISEILEDMLCPYVAPTVTATLVDSNKKALSVLEKGDTVSGAMVKVVVTAGSATLTGIEFFDDSDYSVPSVEPSSISITSSGTYYSESFKLTDSSGPNPAYLIVSDETNDTKTKTNTVSFVYPYYYGAIDAAGDVTADMVTACTKVITSKGNKTYSFTASNQRLMFAYPGSYGVLTKITDANGFDVTDTFTASAVSVTANDGETVTYYVYVGAESTTVSSFNMTFSGYDASVSI